MGRYRAEVVIVGGGVAGAAAARWLAPDHGVRLLERDRIAGEATGHASGLASIAADYAEQPALTRFALDWFTGYEGRGPFEYIVRPNVGLVTPAERADARADGARVETGVEVEAQRVEDGTVVGVETSAGPGRADAVVVAAGWRTRDLVAPAVELPLRPFPYQTVNLAVDRELGPDYPITSEHETHLYWRPEPNGELHVGGGTYFTDGADRRTAVTDSFRRLVAEGLPTRLRGLGDPRVVGEACCPTGDAATPDEYPIVDSPDEGPDGLVVAAGLTGFGIMASPVVGQAVRALVAEEWAPFPLTPLRLDRFEDRGTDFTLPCVVEDPAELAP